MMMQKIGWIRHGATEWNQLGKIQGVTDIPLNSEGAAQADKLAERLLRDGMQWDGVVASDLQRAHQSAAIIADKLGLPLHTDERLRERSFGDAEGTTEQERLMRWGKDWRLLVPGQEADQAIIDRGLHFIADWEQTHPGQSWLVVTHGSFLARMLLAMCPSLVDERLLNTSLSILEKREDHWHPYLYNCTNHLHT